MYSELCHPPKKVCQENREYRSSRDSGAPTNKLYANYRNRTKFRLIVGSVLHLKRVYEGGGEGAIICNKKMNISMPI